MWGSVWPKVLPYCIFNVTVAATIEWLHRSGRYDLAISSTGHSFMNLTLAFLIVNRVTISMSRYSEARDYLGTMYRECRELTQNLVCLTGSNTDQRAKEWRSEVTYRLMMLLRISMGVVDYLEHYVNVWELEDISDAEREEIMRFVYYETTADRRDQNAVRWAHARRTEFEENLRVPIRMAYLLRREIRRHTTELGQPLIAPQELKLFESVDSFMDGYYGIQKFMTTPFPFPLVQMCRTFMFFYVFTVPFALLSDPSIAAAHCITIFILTYGFMGLEFVAIELDNPFGEDDNDFDNLGMAYTTFEDAYLTILDTDGAEWTARLRSRMNPKGEKQSLV